MNRPARLLAALALGALPLAALAAAPIPLPWHAGTRLAYDSVRIDEKKTSAVRRTITSRMRTTIEIAEAREDGYVQVWRDRDGTIDVVGEGPGVDEERAAAERLLEAFEGDALEVELDADGLFTGVRNWATLGAKLRATLAPVLRAGARRQPNAAAHTDAELDARLAPMLERLSTQAAIDATIGRTPQLYNLFTAPNLQPGQPVRYEDELQSPVSEHRIPAIGQFEVLSVDEARDTVTIHWTQSIDPAKGAEAAWGMVAALTGVPKPAGASGLPEALELGDEATVVIHRASGVILHLEHDRRIAMGGQERTMLWTFDRVPDER